MGADQNEIAKFKAWLAKTPPESIQKHLDNDEFLREWKRELALAEVARRGQNAANAASAQRSRAKGTRRAAMYSWVIAIVLVLLVLLASWANF